MFSFKNKQQKQQQEPPTSPGDNTYTRQLHPTKYGRVQTIDSKPFDEKVSDNNLLLTSNEDGSLVESELSTTDQVAPATPAADIVDELDVLGNTTNNKLNKGDLLKLANKEEEGAVSIKKEDLLDNISIFSVKDDSFSVTDGESTDESAKSGSIRSGSTKSSRSGKSKGSGRSSVKSRLSVRSNKSNKSNTLQSVQESNVMSDKQANDAYNKLWHTSNSSQKSGAEEGGRSTAAASQTSEKSESKKKGNAADAQSLDNTFEEDGQSVYSSSYISVYSAAATERSCDSFMSKKSVKSSKKEDVNEAEKKKEEESPKDEEEKEEVSAAKVVVDTHSALEKNKETPNEESEEVEQQKKAPSLPLFNKKNLKSKRFFGKNKNKKDASSENVEDSAPLPVHVNEMSDEEVEITYGSSLPSKEKSTKEDSMARTTSNTTAPTVESKEEEEEEELEKVVPFTVSHSYYGAGAEDEDDGGFFGKLLSCTGVPQCNGGVDGEFDNDMLVDRSSTKEEGQRNDGGEDDDEEDEAYLNVEIFEDGNATRIGYFMESTDEDDANDTSDDRSINMRVRSKAILKTKVPQGSEEDVVDNIANKLQEEQQKDTTTGNSLDNSLKSKKKNVLRMKLLKRLNKKETGTN